MTPLTAALISSFCLWPFSFAAETELATTVLCVRDQLDKQPSDTVL